MILSVLQETLFFAQIMCLTRTEEERRRKDTWRQRCRHHLFFSLSAFTRASACARALNNGSRKCRIFHLPMRGIAKCMKWACSWSCVFPSSAWSPSRSFPRTSWGTLHPHPFRSAKRVNLKTESRPCATGSNGLRSAKAFGFPPSSSWATDRASCATGVPCNSAILPERVALLLFRRFTRHDTTQ